MSDPAGTFEAIRDEVSTVLIGNEDAVERLTISLLTGGHVLVEGVPGVAKTTAANLFARVSGLEYTRIQMTPDILPADITGTKIYREHAGEFDLQEGPVFSNVVVADEINRATPKTQSALLEAMQETRVTIEGETLELPEPFMVIATQNPIEMEGTFSLPEAQRDRFQFKLVVEIPGRDDERELLDRFDAEPGLGPSSVSEVVSKQDLRVARDYIEGIYVADSVKEYVLDLVAATREHGDTAHGASPRASLTFLNTAKAKAALEGREYVIPDDVKGLGLPILRHRLVLNTQAELGDVSTTDVVEEVKASVKPPGLDAVEPVPEDGEVPEAR
jgi:MoxR-like ATPase